MKGIFYLAGLATIFATPVAAMAVLEWNGSYAIISHESNKLQAANELAQELCNASNQTTSLISQYVRQDGVVHSFFACV